MKRGEITHHSFDKLWRTAYIELGVEPEYRPVLLTEIIQAPRSQREKMIEVIVESFNVPAFFLVDSNALGMFAFGATTGIALDCGAQCCRAVPTYEGHSMPHCASKTPQLSGGVVAVDDRLMSLLRERGFDNSEIVAGIKEKHCYVATTSDVDEQRLRDGALGEPSSRQFQLPDGSSLQLSDDRFLAPEILFTRGGGDKSDFLGLPQLLFRSIQKVDDLEFRNQLLQRIVLIGGCSMLEGLAERVKNDLETLYREMDSPERPQISVHARLNRKHGPWVGGSVLSTLSSMKSAWVSKGEYDDYGKSVVHRWCF